MADTANKRLDEELHRILESSGQKNPLPADVQLLKPAQAFFWPWQVPQVPSYTSDHAPGSPI